MISDYEFQNLVNLIKTQIESSQQLTANNILQIAIGNMNDDQKLRLTEAYVEGLISKYKLGTNLFESDIRNTIINNNIIKMYLDENFNKFHDILDLKIKGIFENFDHSSNQDLRQFIKVALYPYIKNYIQNLMTSETKEIINKTLNTVTLAFAEISFKEQATLLFNKAQKIINEEIIKDIIE